MIEFPDGTAYRDESKAMAARIAAGKLMEPDHSADHSEGRNPRARRPFPDRTRTRRTHGPALREESRGVLSPNPEGVAMKARALAAPAGGRPAGRAAVRAGGRVQRAHRVLELPRRPAGQRTGDIFTMNPDGSDLRRLTTNPADDAQSDWAPDGRDIAYRIRKPNRRSTSRSRA